MHKVLATLVVAPLLLAVAACGDDDDTPDEPPGTTTPSETALTTTTTVATEGPQEWVAVAQDIHQRWDDLLRDPDPDRVGEIIAETCECWDTRFGTVEFLASEQDHIEGPPIQVLFVKHEQTNEETGLVDLTVKLRLEDLRRVDSDGEVVEEIPVDDPDGDGGCMAITVRQDGPEDSWRIYSEVSLTGCPPEAV